MLNTKTGSKQHGESCRVHTLTQWQSIDLCNCVCVCQWVCGWAYERGLWEVRQFSWPASEKKLSDTQQTNRQTTAAAVRTHKTVVWWVIYDMKPEFHQVSHYKNTFLLGSYNSGSFGLICPGFSIDLSPLRIFFLLDLISCNEIDTEKTADSELSH